MTALGVQEVSGDSSWYLQVPHASHLWSSWEVLGGQSDEHPRWAPVGIKEHETVWLLSSSTQPAPIWAFQGGVQLTPPLMILLQVYRLPLEERRGSHASNIIYALLGLPYHVQVAGSKKTVLASSIDAISSDSAAADSQPQSSTTGTLGLSVEDLTTKLEQARQQKVAQWYDGINRNKESQQPSWMQAYQQGNRAGAGVGPSSAPARLPPAPPSSASLSDSTRTGPPPLQPGSIHAALMDHGRSLMGVAGLLGMVADAVVLATQEIWGYIQVLGLGWQVQTCHC
jgi:hypothetical protein